MMHRKNTSVIIITLFLSFMVIVGLNVIENDNFKTERDNLIANINSSITQEISSNNDKKLESISEIPQNNWGFSYVEYNPNSGIISNSTIKNGEFVESFESSIK